MGFNIGGWFNDRLQELQKKYESMTGNPRGYDKDKDNDSPYNTYKYKGLPPGPISLVGAQAINSVIDYNKHKFLFFCAKPDLSGYSNFSETYEQHEKYARQYQQTMNKKGIK